VVGLLLVTLGDQVIGALDDQVVRPQTRQLLENLRDTAPLVLGRYLDVLAWNHLATAVIKDFATSRRQERNFLQMLFLDPEVRSRFVDWEPVAGASVGCLRAAAPSEPLLSLISDRLHRNVRRLANVRRSRRPRRSPTSPRGFRGCSWPRTP
jgi:hypothetical protein